MTEQHKQHLTIVEQIKMRIAEYKQKYYKDPTHIVMSLPVHSIMMHECRYAFENEIVPTDFRMKSYGNLTIIVLEVQDTILLVG
ncbi:hypothetical protein Goe25_02430 [Bacillus phage vB_BsuM-Goe25]|nr:hypothetical protein Goe25_02430 [Bacillus phage vB_BsuM-Goe25]